MKLRRFLPSLIAVAVLVPVSIWALLTLKLQSELVPLFPPHLKTVHGVQLSMSVLSSAQEVMLLLTPPAATGDLADRLERELKQWPAVEAVSEVGRPRLEPLVEMIAWGLANLPPETFAEFQSLYAPANLSNRLAQTESQLAGVLDGRDLFLLRFDPLQILPWLQSQPQAALPLPDLANVSETPPFILLKVRARQPLRGFEQCQEFIAHLRQIVDAVVPASMRPAVYITGQPAFVAENSSQMKGDITIMVVLAVGLTWLLLWVFYRSQAALLWMTVVLALALLAGAVAARLLFGELNVISIGFASILIGLGSDYCILVYHFHTQHDPALDREAAWRTVRRSIWLSATTTSLAFGALYFSSFPGMQQLVVLIAAGLLATAFFATTLLAEILRHTKPVAPQWLTHASDWLAAFETRRARWIVGVVAGLALAAVLVWPVARHYRFYEPDFDRLQPATSEAYQGLRELLKATQAHPTLEVMVTGRDLPELRARAARVLPSALLAPQSDFITANRQQWRSGHQADVRAALETAGFETEWGAATLRLLDELDRWAAGKSDFASARLFLSNVAESPTGGPMALLRVPVTNDLASAWAEVSAREPSALSASWRLMMEDLQHRVLTDARRLSLWMLVAVVAVSWWARRSWRPVALNGLALVLTFGGLLAILWLTREVMTLQSLLTLPVLLAVAVEYSLYMQLGLHAHAGDTRLAFRHLTVPVLLMGLTTIIGFGAPVATKQPMLKNFGMVMAWGTFAAMMTGLVVIPACELFRRNHPHHSETLYRARWFEWGAWLAPRLGWSGARRLGRWLGELYRLTHPQTADAVRSNLAAVKPAPVDEALVRQAFRNYGATLADYFLLGTRPRTEVLDMVEPPVGLEHFQEICGPGQAAVIVTAHLGLFELGSLFTADLKPPPLVLSLPEPSVALGRWRAAYRQRWGAETLEVGDDQFSFVKITRELAKGRSVALLADRPSDTNRVWVDFPHGAMPFSTGPVWLSLLSGCPILAVTTVRLPSGRYRMEAHPPLAPKWLNGSREETVEHYTRQLAAIFRKAICEYPDQWYQFVPLSRSR